jgi:hypothetical protein
MAATTTPPPLDSKPAFLFRCGDSNLCAITLDEAGENLPKDECADGWRLMQSFALGVQEPVPASIDPEKVIAGIEVCGFYIWHDMSVSITRAPR